MMMMIMMMMIMKFQNDFLKLIDPVRFRFEQKKKKKKKERKKKTNEKNWYNSQTATTSIEGKVVDGDGSMDVVFSIIITKTLLW